MLSSDALLIAYEYIANNDVTNGIRTIDDIIFKFPNTAASYQARLIKADIFIKMHMYNDALTVLKKVLKNGRPTIVRPLASYRIVYAYDSKKDYFSAIAASRRFIKEYSDHFLVKDVYMNLAENYLDVGFKNDAIKTFNELIVKFPDSSESKKAKLKLNCINKVN
jgi:TolA-binding protein